MLAEIDKKKFENALKGVSKAIEKRGHFDTVRIAGVYDTVTITATNGDTSIQKRIKDVKIVDDFEFLVNHEVISKLVKLIKDDTISLIGKDNDLKILGSKNEANVKLASYEPSFLYFPEKMIARFVSTTTEQTFRKLFNTGLICVASDDSRPILEGIKLERRGSGITSVSADGFKLGTRTIHTYIGGNHNHLDTVIHGDVAVAWLYATDAKQDNPVTFGMGDFNGKEVFYIESDDTLMITYPIEGRFPMWKEIIPTWDTHDFTADVKELAEANQTALTISKENNYTNRYTFTVGGLTVWATASETGAIKTFIQRREDTTESPDVEIAFNGQYVTSILNGCAGDVTIQVFRSDRPAIFKDADQLFVLMPMHMGR